VVVESGPAGFTAGYQFAEQGFGAVISEGDGTVMIIARTLNSVWRMAYPEISADWVAQRIEPLEMMSVLMCALVAGYTRKHNPTASLVERLRNLRLKTRDVESHRV
jgi:hypothetical protein